MVLLAALLGASLSAAAQAPSAPQPLMTERERALHALNRLGYGPRPGDLEKVEAMGVDAWIELQLNPDRIPDAAMDARLKAYPSLVMTGAQLMDAYPTKKFIPNAHPKELYKEISAVKLLRADMSERQLFETLTDFWYNHFNVLSETPPNCWLFLPYERDVIRPRVFGKFRDLLGAVAHSPSMLAYLDNVMNVADPRYAPAVVPNAPNNHGLMALKEERLGINENYARELMELHTLGVDGGYTQKDVTELARILTGWTFEPPDKKQAGGRDFRFAFHGSMHDPGEKVLLGRPYAGAGEAEGETALDRLARDPHTAHFIALKLCRRFVSDDPPAEVVARVAKRFSDTDGDLRETYRALFTAPEFWQKRFFRAKVKTPFEFIASVLRATGAEVRDPEQAALSLHKMGMPLYRCEPPTGWPDRAEAWVGAGALAARLKTASKLFDRQSGDPLSASPEAAVGDADRRDGRALLGRLTSAYLGGMVADRTMDALVKRLDDPEVSGESADGRRPPFRLDRLGALVLATPDFELR